MQLRVRWPPRRHVHEDTSEGPHIHSRAVLALRHDLGRHVLRRAAEGRGAGEVARETPGVLPDFWQSADGQRKIQKVLMNLPLTVTVQDLMGSRALGWSTRMGL